MNLKRLDNIFSKYIRLRDANRNGMGRCVSCGNLIHWKFDAQAGHFIPRGKKAVKFDERNVSAQCVACNNYKYGRTVQYAYSIELDKRFGKGTAEQLYLLSKKTCKLTRDWYEFMIKEYKEKAIRIAVEKGLEL
jgi:hypothetical protein